MPFPRRRDGYGFHREREGEGFNGGRGRSGPSARPASGGSSTPAPRTQTPAPATQSPAPRTQTPAPAIQAPAPQTQSPLPRTQSPAPQTQSPLPQTQSPAPSGPTGASAGRYRDGTYSGTGYGPHGPISVEVTVQASRIASTQITMCGTRYPCSWISALPGEVIAQQTVQVDMVSGATASSEAFLGAVAQALSKAG